MKAISIEEEKEVDFNEFDELLGEFEAEKLDFCFGVNLDGKPFEETFFVYICPFSEEIYGVRRLCIYDSRPNAEHEREGSYGDI
jgi:hypothetical protein